MYFIEHLCEVAQRENHLDFVRMMQRDILRVVDAVAPSDGSGAANVKVVRRVRTPSSPSSTIPANTPFLAGPSRSPTKAHPPPRNRPRNRSRSRRTGHRNLIAPFRALTHLVQSHPSGL